MEGLGRLFDIGVAAAPVDLNTADGFTGKRISVVGASGLTIAAFVGAAASGTDDLVFTLKQHTAYTGGTTSNAAAISRFYVKSETALDNDESWVPVSQSVGATVTLAGATYAAVQKLVVIELDVKQLSDGCTHVSLDAAVTTAAAQLASALYIRHGLFASRAPANLGNLLRPGAANA